MLPSSPAVPSGTGPRLFCAGCFALAILSLFGCAEWKMDAENASARGGLPEARIPDDVAILEVAFVRIVDHETLTPGTELPWDRLDETVVDSETRECLNKNGIRAGRILSIDSSQLGDQRPSDDSTRLMQEADVASDFEHRHRRLSCRDGQLYSLAVRRPTGARVPVLLCSVDNVVAGRSLDDPQFMLNLRTRMLDDGRVAVRLVPEIQHGQVRQNYVTRDAAFRMEFHRQRWTLDELLCEVPLSDGQAMVIMASKDTFGLGQQMFVGRRADLSEERIAVVLRLHRRPRRPPIGS